jgi:hypothetical protein
MRIALITLLSVLFLQNIFAARNSSRKYQKAPVCFPENSLRFPTNLKGTSGLTEFETNQLLERFRRKLQPTIKKAMGKKLIIELNWENERVNASATRDDANNPVVIVFGGMARHNEMTRDGLVSILCHELGHHMGGAPKKYRGRSKKRSWSSAEGQADYYASTKCLPLLFNDGSETVNLSLLDFPENVSRAEERCGNNPLCTRITLAGLAIGRVFATLKGYYQMPSLERNDHGRVWETNYSHPVPQCRVDTFVAGAQCSIPPRDGFDPIDPSVGACYRDQGETQDVQGARPRCWYFPASSYR